MNSYFGYSVIEKIKLVSFDNTLIKFKKNSNMDNKINNLKHIDKIINIKNEKIKKSLLDLSKVFKQK